MYHEFYGFTEEPFRLSPDVRFCFKHRSFAKAKAYFQYALHHGEGFVLITGQPGTGKTTLIDDLLGELAHSRTLTVRLESAQVEADDLMRRVGYAFGLEARGIDKATLLNRLERHLEAGLQHHDKALLIVDEAQALPASALEELRLITNLRARGRPLVQIFLVGQEALRELIRAPELEQLHQRILCACHLDPLPLGETRDYIAHRLHCAGWRGDPVIEAGAVRALHRASQGIPRLINKYTNRLLLHGGLGQLHRLTETDAVTVLTELQAELLLKTPVDQDTLSDLNATATIADIALDRNTLVPPAAAPTPASDDWLDALVPPPQTTDTRTFRVASPLPNQETSGFRNDHASPPSPSKPVAHPASPLHPPIADTVMKEEFGAQLDRFVDASPPLQGETALQDQPRPLANPNPSGDTIEFTAPGRERARGSTPVRREPGRRGLPWILALVATFLLALGALYGLQAGGWIPGLDAIWSQWHDWFAGPAKPVTTPTTAPDQPVDDRTPSSSDRADTALTPPPVSEAGAVTGLTVPDQDTPGALGTVDRLDTASPSNLADTEEPALPEPRVPPLPETPSVAMKVPASDLAEPDLPVSPPSSVASAESPAAPPILSPPELVETVPHQTMPVEAMEPAPVAAPARVETVTEVAPGPLPAPMTPTDIDTRVPAIPPPEPAHSIPAPAAVAVPEMPAGNETTSTRQPLDELAEELTKLGLVVAQTPEGLRINLRNRIPLEFDSALIPTQSAAILDELVQRLGPIEGVRLQIEGHTDDVGDAAYNRALSLRRAQALKAALAQRGIPPERITAIGRGEETPLVPVDQTSTNEQRLENRRLELLIRPKFP